MTVTFCVDCGNETLRGEQAHRCLSCHTQHRKRLVAESRKRHPDHKRRKRLRYRQRESGRAMLRLQCKRRWERIKSDPERLARERRRGMNKHYAVTLGPELAELKMLVYDFNRAVACER